jgi:hypothetical protein
MLKNLFFAFLLFIIPLNASGYFVKSAEVDTSAFGGFGPSENSPKQLSDFKLPYSENSLQLLWTETNDSAFIYVLNTTTMTHWFPAHDSELYIYIEIFEDYRWTRITPEPNLFCGNSQHRVALKPNTFWAIPFRTLLKNHRLAMKIDKEKFIFSSSANTTN